MKQFFGKTVLLLAALLLLMIGASASAEVKLAFSPENPRMGDYVTVTVTPDREGAQGVHYTLSTEAETVFKSDEMDTHLTASFRPRQEAVYTLAVTVVYGRKDKETVSVTIPVSGVAPAQESRDVIYSQRDGWWKDKVYSKTYHRSVQKAGCALFTLSHALQRMGLEGEEIRPDKLAEKYSGFYIEERGTDNERLLLAAGERFGFVTHEDLIETEAEISAWFRRGSYFSFSLVIGHIALADGLSEDGTKVHVVDSAPTATFERLKGAKVYVRQDDGSFTEAAVPEDVPGCRYFFETQNYGGLEYWMDLSYCASRGMRLLCPPWLTLDGAVVNAFEYAGALVTKVAVGEETKRVSTRDLTWTTLGADEPKIAIIKNNKGVKLLDGNGKAKKNKNGVITARLNAMMPVLEITDEYYFVACRDYYGFIPVKSADLLSVYREDYRTGVISLNGRTAGTSPVSIRREPTKKSAEVATWKPGTPVAVIGQQNDFWFVEGKGFRGWVNEKYLTLEGEDPNGQTIDEGE